jgi:predicted acetyltransferase
MTLRPVGRRDVRVVERLVQLYLYDLVGERFGVERDGRYAPAAWHRQFWRRRGAHHFLVRVGGRPAGFALVRDRATHAGEGVREISEFFVLRRHRGRGTGTRVARALFARWPGRWEVAVLVGNPARRFWRGVIRRAATRRVVTRRRRLDDLVFVVHEFDTLPTRRGRG